MAEGINQKNQNLKEDLGMEAGQTDPNLSESFGKEYYKLVDIVSNFDKNLLTVKGWGVTLGLAALAWGFEKQHYGLFLVACLSGVAFWTIETVMKRHQMRYYVRMREIEVVGYELSRVTLPDGSYASSPQIDWSWERARKLLEGKNEEQLAPERYKEKSTYAISFILPHVFFPHAITAILGLILFILGYLGKLGAMSL